MNPDLHAAVMLRHGRPTPTGHPARCANGRVVFDMRASALAAAAELRAAGERSQETFDCRLGGGQHFHLRPVAPVAIGARQDGVSQ